MIVLVDNYDSFSYNLYQMIGELEPDIKVIRNDAMTVAELEAMEPDGIILSPGPGRPEDAGICIETAEKLSGKIPILGVCLGHQAICKAFGATVSYAKELMHGKQSETEINTDSPIFKGLEENIRVGRYHSLAVLEETLPTELKAIARTADGEIMAVQHESHPTFGLQFHPESILTPRGSRMLENFLQICKKNQ